MSPPISAILRIAVATLFTTSCTLPAEQVGTDGDADATGPQDIASAVSDTADDASEPDVAGLDAMHPDAIQNFGGLTAANPGKIAGVAAGKGNTCVWNTEGLAYCWGSNDDMLLGGMVNSLPKAVRPNALPFPITITELTDVKEMVAHREAICARVGSGMVKCWGYFDYVEGYCGGEDWRPELVDEIGVVSALTNAYHFVGGITADKHVVEWGRSTTLWTCDYCCDMPAQFQAMDDIVSVGVGWLSCAVTGQGKLWCWGDHLDPIVGGPPVEPNDTGWTEVAAVASGGESACALMKNGEVRCFGHNRGGSLGIGAPEQAWVHADDAKPIQTLNDAVAVWGAWDFYCALRSDASLWCWGDGPQDGDQESAGQLSKIDLPDGVKSCSLGRHKCALLNNGEVWCWGANPSGQLGDGTTTDSLKPVKVQFGG